MVTDEDIIRIQEDFDMSIEKLIDNYDEYALISVNNNLSLSSINSL